jgi:sodium/hydrogen antiporter
MSEYQILTVLAAFVFLYSVVAARLERTPLSGALVYVLAGLICGPGGLNLIDLDVDAHGIRWLAELTLALVLFTDSASANLLVLRRFEAIPVRLLLVGLPLTFLLGFGVGALLFPDLGWIDLALLATMLAPTDAALGKAVVTNPAVPDSVRESLNVESGLNDGICVPFLLLFLALAAGHVGRLGPIGLAVKLALTAIGIGAAVGLALGAAGSVVIRSSVRRGWIAGTWLQVPVLALALLCFASAQWLGGSGFIASFVGGMTFGALRREDKQAVLEAAEGTGDTLALLTWFIFGTLLLARPFPTPDWRMVAYALASLTVVRMLPVFVSVAGLGVRTDTKLFLGWFGPRGLASIVFAVMVLDEQLPSAATLVTTAACTILLSILLHGLSANPLASIYSRRVGDASI